MNITIEYIDEWASRLLDRLIEIRYLEPQVMKAALSSHFRSAILDCMEARFSEVQKEIIRLKQEMGSDPRKSFTIGTQLAKLKSKQKEMRQIAGHVQDYNECVEFKRFVFNKYPTALNDWDKASKPKFSLDIKAAELLNKNINNEPPR